MQAHTTEHTYTTNEYIHTPMTVCTHMNVYTRTTHTTMYNHVTRRGPSTMCTACLVEGKWHPRSFFGTWPAFEGGLTYQVESPVKVDTLVAVVGVEPVAIMGDGRAQSHKGLCKKRCALGSKAGRNNVLAPTFTLGLVELGFCVCRCPVARAASLPLLLCTLAA